MNKFKICGFVQVFNELEKGNLERFIKFFLPLVDDLVVYDDSSNDGSFEYLINFIPKDKIIRGAKNSFNNEIGHKQILLERIKNIEPDFILWLDVDEVLSSSRENLEEICQYCLNNNYDGANFKEVNLYRSYSHKRLDSSFDDGVFTRLWKFSNKLFYYYEFGLHSSMVPKNINKIFYTDKVFVLHYGFSNSNNLAYKYWTYKKNGQNGYLMLDRLIFSNDLKFEKLENSQFPCKSLVPEISNEPENISFIGALAEMWSLKPKVKRVKFSIICLIYKDTNLLEFVYNQVIKYTNFDDKEFFFVVNDGSEKVKNFLENNLIKHFIFENSPEQKKQWYINNVYRAYNFGATKANGEYIIFIKPDMAFSPNWFENLWQAYDGKSCISSRLIESGKLKTGTFGIEKFFGSSFSNYEEGKFQNYIENISENTINEGGIYMPLFIKKSHFFDAGMYPEGNVRSDSDIFNPIIAEKSDDLIFGDKVLMMKLKKSNIIHKTAFNSIVYNFQCGEMDENTSCINDSQLFIKKTLIVANNYVIKGAMGESTLWSDLIKYCKSSLPVDIFTLNTNINNYEYSAKNFLSNTLKDIDLVFQNGTFIPILDCNKFNIVYIQDNLRKIKREGLCEYHIDVMTQQEENIRNADIVITNSLELIKDYNEFNFDYLINIGIDHNLFNDFNNKYYFREKYKLPSDKRIGIFVDAINEMKGCSEMQLIIDSNVDIHWIVVSKLQNDILKKQNVSIFTKIAQDQLSELYNASDFFIATSRSETQCLAAMEGAMCNLPIIIYNTGFAISLSEIDKKNIGMFVENDSIVNKMEYFLSILSGYKPRQTMINLGFTKANSINNFIEIFSHALIRGKKKKQLSNKENNLQDYQFDRKINELINKKNYDFNKKIDELVNKKDYELQDKIDELVNKKDYELHDKIDELVNKKDYELHDKIDKLINRNFSIKRLIKNIKKESHKLFKKNKK